MIQISKFDSELNQLKRVLTEAKTVLVTAPGAADGDSLGAQLSIRRIIKHNHPHCDIVMLSDEAIPARYRFLPDIDQVLAPEDFEKQNLKNPFDVAVIVDGGVDRAGRVIPLFKEAKCTVLIDHHIISAKYDYNIRIVDATASSTTELIYYLAGTSWFQTPIGPELAQQLYLGLIFDTGFFRHANTTPESMELGASLIRTGFDFTRVGERGMLERSFDSLQLMAYTLTRAKLRSGGRVIWSQLTQDDLKSFRATGDDREGIIDHLFLTEGVQVAVLFFELPDGRVKVSLRSLGAVDVASFARSLTEFGGGHTKAAGALMPGPLNKCVTVTLKSLEQVVEKIALGRSIA